MNPYLSLVAAARNDDYGGHFLERCQAFLSHLAELCEKHRLPCELIVVEWNPPTDKPRLAQALRVPSGLTSMQIRFVEVPPEAHASLDNADRVALFEYIAKNVGIRRSRGAFVLATNPDLMFSEALVATLSRKNLLDNAFYRVDRYDFKGPIPMHADLRQRMLHISLKTFVAHLRPASRRRSSVRIAFYTRRFFHHTHRWPSTAPRHPASADTATKMNDDRGLHGGLHTNGAGDFILAARAAWHRIRGFPEFTDTFMHLDGYGCHQLRAIGLDQRIFAPPCMIFHCDHGRLEQRARPQYSQEKWTSDLEALRSGRMSPIINGENWGLGERELPEQVFGVR